MWEGDNVWKEFELWVEVYRKPFIQQTTYTKYQRSVVLVKEYFGNKSAKRIKRIELQKYFNELSTKYEKLTIKAHYQHLFSFYQSLVDEGDLDRNPMKNIKYSGVVREKKKKFLEMKEVRRIVRGLDLENPDHLMIYVSLKTGMRFAEILGITTADVYKQGKIYMLSINKTFDYKYTKDFKETKTINSMREISIEPIVYHELLALAERKGLEKNESIFGYKASATINRQLEKVCIENKVEPISFHGLRHTHGSMLLSQGIPMLSVSKRLGHANLSTTQDVYIHLMQEQERKDNKRIVDVMAKIW